MTSGVPALSRGAASEATMAVWSVMRPCNFRVRKGNMFKM